MLPVIFIAFGLMLLLAMTMLALGATETSTHKQPNQKLFRCNHYYPPERDIAHANPTLCGS